MEVISESYSTGEIPEKKRNTDIKGPWVNEPDLVFWIDEDTGFPCLINRAKGGYLWGCVGVDEKHSLHHRDYKHFSGYSGLNLLISLEKTLIYSKLLPYRDYWFYEFDFGHSWDYSPFCDYNNEDYTKYKTVEYAMDKCHSLAKELKDYNPAEDFRGRLKHLKEQIEKIAGDFDNYLEEIEGK
jgi:hypothetical protein